MTREEVLEEARRIAHVAVDAKALVSDEQYEVLVASVSRGETNWTHEAKSLALGFLEEAEDQLNDELYEEEFPEEDDEEEGDEP